MTDSHSIREQQERLRTLQNKYIKTTVQLCAVAHPYYQKLFKELNLKPEDITTVDDLRKIPMLPKKEYTRDPEMFKLNLDNISGLATEETTLADIIYTTGSSGTPAPFYDTVHDRFARIDLMKRAALIAGITPNDTVINLFPLTSVPHQGFLSATWGSMAIGSKLLTGLTGRNYAAFPVHNRLDQVIDMIERERVTVLWGISTYVRRVVMRALELGKDFRSVRLALVMGEPCPPGMRQDIISRLKAMGSVDPSTNNGYGLTETLGPAMECVEFSGAHQPAPEQFYFEVVDSDTGAPVPDGEKGMLLLSHLNRRGTVLLRYIAGDIVSLSHKTCSYCGRWEPRFLGTPYRADGLSKVKGTLINPGILHHELASLMADGLSEYQVVITRENPEDQFSGDAILLRLACEPNIRARLEQEAKEIVNRTLEMTPLIEFLDGNAFPEIGHGYKFKRFIDKR